MTDQVFVNFYELLQVTPTAAERDVRDAVRKQRRIWVKRQASADPIKRADADTKVRQIDAAEKTLLDPNRRWVFDQELANYHPPAAILDSQASSDLLERAQAYLEQGNASAAHTAACEVINQHGADDVAWYVRAHASFLMGQPRNAEYEFAEAIRLRPNDPGYHFDLGDAYAQQEKWPEALREFETALRLDPNNPQYRTAIAEVYCATDNASRALQIMERVVAEYPYDQSFRYYLAIALHDSAIEAMSRFPDGHMPTTEQQVAIAEQQAYRIESLGLADPEVHEWVTGLRELAREARHPRWVHSGNLRYYVIAVLALLIIPALTGAPGVTILGLVIAAGVIWLYVHRHRKPAWAHRRTVLAHEMIEPGI
jgi:tetratricopeptide (TPR) repeat protein